MAENESFFRKVVRFVANPATDWTDLNSRQEDSRETGDREVRAQGHDRAQAAQRLRAQARIRHAAPVRREGLSPEQLAALGTSSRLDDSEVRLPDGDSRGPHRWRQGQDRRDRAADGGRRQGFNTSRSKATGGTTSTPSRPRRAFNR
jgi:hypothetical protein